MRSCGGEADEPLFLYHYYEAAIGPFRSLSELDREDAEDILQRLRDADQTFAARRAADYLAVRQEIERRIRERFVRKGGSPRRAHPYYLIVGPCAWLRGWYQEGRAVRIALAAIPPRVVSFTYGDSFPAMRYQDGKPYRGQVYTREELPGLIRAYGWPQQWNPTGAIGPDRYIEAQVWDRLPPDALTDGV